MVFSDALMALEQGYKIKLPWWGGYWYKSIQVDPVDPDNCAKHIIMIHTKGGAELKLTDVDDIFFTLRFTTSDQWEIVKENGEL